MVIAGLSAASLIYQGLIAAVKKQPPASGTAKAPDRTAQSTYTGPRPMSLDEAIEGVLRGDPASLEEVRRHLEAGEIIQVILAEEGIVNRSVYTDRDREEARKLLEREKKRFLYRFVRPEKIVAKQNKRDLVKMFVLTATNPELPVPPLANLDELPVADLNDLIRLYQLYGALQRIYKPLHRHRQQPAHLTAFALRREVAQATLNDGSCYPAAVIMIDFARAIGLPLTLVQTERHILVSLRLSSGERILFDPLSGTFLPANYYLDRREMIESNFDTPLDRLLINPVATQQDDPAVGSVRIAMLASLFPEEPSLLVFHAGLLLTHGGKAEEAIGLAREALRRDPNHLGILIAAINTIAPGNLEEALALTDEGRRLIAHRLAQGGHVRSLYVDLYHQRTRLLDALGRYEEAGATLDELKRLIATHKTDERIFLFDVESNFDNERTELIGALAAGGHWVAAIRLYRNTVRRLSPGNTMVTIRLAPLMSRAGNFDRAVAAWREVIAGDATAISYLYTLIAVNAEMGEAEGLPPAIRFAIRLAEAMETELRRIRPMIRDDIFRWRRIVGDEPTGGGSSGPSGGNGGNGSDSGKIDYRRSAPTGRKPPRGGSELLPDPVRGGLLLFDLPEVPLESTPRESLPPAGRPLLLP